MQKVSIISHNGGNIRSVQYALERQNVAVSITHNSEEILNADKLVIPGQGQAQLVMEYINKWNIGEVLKSYKKPILGICIGQQIICKSSEEGKTKCLDLFPLKVQKFNENKKFKVPHIGWNTIYDCNGLLTKDIEGEHLYYVHSYYCELGASTVGITNHGIPFTASLEKDNFFSFQAHLEKSGMVGEKVIKKFLSL